MNAKIDYNTANIVFSTIEIKEITITGNNTLEAGLETNLVG